MKPSLYTPFVLAFLISFILIGIPSPIKGDAGERNQLNQSVTHDDRFILYQSRDKVEEDDYFDIWRMDLVTKEKEQLTYSNYDEVRPKINFDGKKILFTSFDPQKKSSLWLMNSNGSNPYKITPEEFNCENGTFHPIERKIIYCSDENNLSGKYNIWEMDYDGANRSLLISVDGQPLAPSYSADGKQVVFDLLNIDGSYSIMHYDRPSGNLTEVLSGRYIRNPVFYSNDKICLLSSYIIMFNLTTGYQERIGMVSGIESFCFDSTKIHIYYSAQDGYGPVNVLWVMDIEGSNIEELVPSGVGTDIMGFPWYAYPLVLLELLPFFIIVGFIVWYIRFRRKKRDEL